jgi:hypothetical protein
MMKLSAAYVLLAIVAQWHVGCTMNANVLGKFGGTDKAYPGAERPASEISIFQCGFNLAVLAIDENRSLVGETGSCSYALLPGRHTFRVSIRQSDVGGKWVQFNDQVVEYDLVAGKTYSLHASPQDKDSLAAFEIYMVDPVLNKFVTVAVFHCGKDLPRGHCKVSPPGQAQAGANEKARQGVTGKGREASN